MGTGRALRAQTGKRCFVALLLALGGWGQCGCRDSTSAETLPVTKATHHPAVHDEQSTIVLSPEQRRIRVLISDQVRECRVQLHQPFELRDPDEDRPLSDRLDPMTLQIRFQGKTMTIPALDLTSARAIEICPGDGAPAEVELVGETSRDYPGRLRFLPAARNTRGGTLVNVVDVEDYLVGVVTAELHQGFHRRACRAQAIASRTYAWYWINERSRSGDWDIRASEGAQVYLGLGRAERVPEATQAVRDTEGLVLTWDGPEGRRIFCAYYSSTCGGRTQPAGPVMREKKIPPLAGRVQCDGCRGAPAFEWAPVSLTAEEITDALRSRYEAFQAIGTITRIAVTLEEEGGRAVRLRMYDAQGRSLPLEAENFRLAVDPGGRRMRSTWFTIESQEGRFRFQDGRGFGHGVGMCQYGAQGMAERGASTIEILQHYYPDSQVVRAY